jgi:tripartite-type tricarboxylate transporter receptor subunit TctC
VKLPRRRFLRLAVGAGIGAGLGLAAPHIVRAQAYPARPVRIVVGFPPGSGTDITARLIAQWLSERLGQQFVVENRPGAGNNLGTEAVIRSPADGYMILLVGVPSAINATLYQNLSFNVIRDIAPVAAISQVPNVMEVHPSVPVATVPEFIAYAKANPGKLNFGSGGNGTSQHVCGELFKMMAGVDMVHVPYRGAALALVDLLSGQMQVMFDVLPGSIQHIKDGKLRALAVTTAARSDALPNLPTVADVLPGYEGSSWYGLGVPTGTPGEIVDKLNKEVNAALAEPKMKARLAEMGAMPLGGTPADFAKLLADETEKWGKVVKFSGARAD